MSSIAISSEMAIFLKVGTMDAQSQPNFAGKL